MRTMRLCLIAVTVFLLLPIAAMAYQLDLFGISARSIALANSYSILSDGPEACYYNPGALIESKTIRGFAGYMYAMPAMSVEQRDKNSQAYPASDEVKAAKLIDPAQWFTIGVSGGIKERVYLGIITQIPLDGSQRRKWFSPDQPYFLNYDTGVFGWTIVPAVGVQVIPNVGIGLGAHIIIDGSGDIAPSIPVSTVQDPNKIPESHVVAHDKMDGQFAPIIGVYGRPLEYLRVGATYRGQSQRYLDKHYDQILDATTGSFVNVEYEVKYNFKPRTFTLAVSGNPTDYITLIGQFTWENWRSYDPPFPKMSVNYRGIPVHASEKVFDVPNVNFSDCVVPSFGFEGRPMKYMNMDIGYAFRTNPVPDQTGTTNILNSPVHVLGIGLGGQFLGPKNDIVHIDAGFQIHIMRSQEVTKVKSNMLETDPTTNPMYPKLYTAGAVLVGGMTASLKF